MKVKLPAIHRLVQLRACPFCRAVTHYFTYEIYTNGIAVRGTCALCGASAGSLTQEPGQRYGDPDQMDLPSTG